LAVQEGPAQAHGRIIHSRGFERNTLPICMRALANEEIFSSVSEILHSAASMVRSGERVTLATTEATLPSSLAIAPIEAALLDEGLPYRRSISDGRKSGSINPESTFIIIDMDNDGITISEKGARGLHIGANVPTIAHMGQHAKARNGILTPTAISHALAQLISPSGKRVRRMRPWVISGNWINPSMDATYDPVYTSLRDFLEEEGTISVVPFPEVPDPDPQSRPWVNSDDLDAVRERWAELDAEGRARAISHLMRPGLFSSAPSTARFEELGWHCILAPTWERDLAGQIREASSIWGTNNREDAAGKLIDSLISNGQIRTIQSE